MAAPSASAADLGKHALCLDCRALLSEGELCYVNESHSTVRLDSPRGCAALVSDVWGPEAAARILYPAKAYPVALPWRDPLAYVAVGTVGVLLFALFRVIPPELGVHVAVFFAAWFGVARWI